MTTLYEAAQQAKQVPLRELLASVPADARLVIDDADGKGTRFIPVGRLCREAAAALAEPTCCCGEPTAAGVVHRRDGPCYMAEPVQEPVTGQSRFHVEEWPQGSVEQAQVVVAAPPQPLNLRDPAVQKRLAAQWGYVKAEPVQEPVAKVELMLTGGNAGLATRIVEIDDHLRERLRPGQLLYTSPPQRKPLTDAEIADIWNCFCDELGEASINDAIEIARAIERAHGITTNERKLK